MINISKIKDFFGFETDPIFGLDISSASVKALQLSTTNDRIRVDNYAVEPLPPGVVQEKNIVDKEKVAAAIRAVVIKAGITSQKVCSSVANPIAVTKIIKMPGNMNDKEIRTEIEVEAAKIIPYPIHEVNLDYLVLGPAVNLEGIVNVLVVATKTENVSSLSDIIMSAGLNPVIIDIDGYAIARAFDLVAKKLPAQGKDKIIGVFDIGAVMTTLNIIDDGNLTYMREHNFGSQQLVDEVQNIYGLTYDEAIVAMRYETLPKDYYHEVLQPFKDAITQQISRACQSFLAGGEYSIIDYIFLTGGFTNIFGLDKDIQDKLQIKTFVANPFGDMLLSPQINKDEFKYATNRLMKCCGLALRNIMRT